MSGRPAAAIAIIVVSSSKVTGATLGAALLSGIRPEVAQTLVGLDIDLGTLQSVANLGEALELAR